MRAHHLLPTTLLLGACVDRQAGEDWTEWYDDGTAYEVVEPLSFTPDDYAPTAAPATIAEARGVMTSTFDNEGPLFAAEDWDPAWEGDPGTFSDDRCAFWDVDPSATLPMVVEGVVTSHPRVYRKIEGCGGDERYYGSFWIEDASGGVFVLGDRKVAPFDMGARVRMEVRAVRRRFGLDMVYVHDVLEVERGPIPMSFDRVDRPLVRSDQSRMIRASGTVVQSPTTFGEVLVQLDDGPACAPDDETTRKNCLWVNIDQELNARGITFEKGESIVVTGPVSPFSWFKEGECDTRAVPECGNLPSGQCVCNFYGPYISRVGQITRR